MSRNDQEPYGAIGDFESTSSYLLSFDPVTKRKHARDKRNYASISESNTEVSFSLAMPKLSIGKTRDKSRHYEQEGFYKVTKKQKEELCECRKYLNSKMVKFSKKRPKV